MWTSAGGVKRTVPRRCMACSALATGRGAATSWRSMIRAPGAWCATMLRIACVRAAMTARCPAGGPTKSERAVISTWPCGCACAAVDSRCRSAALTREELKGKPISTVSFTSSLPPMPAAEELTGVAVGAGRTAVFTLGTGQEGTPQYTYRVVWPLPTWVMSKRGAGTADARGAAAVTGRHADVPHAHSEATRHAISALRSIVCRFSMRIPSVWIRSLRCRRPRLARYRRSGARSWRRSMRLRGRWCRVQAGLAR